ncbi:inactive serine/threonine-protein kinase 19-like isoform X1 [Metopolophium dirhodum]|uniref:inactive serine/threonine-protein kinase 19-like isoform X1 n=1 Tax=Metopolophium dirhodum TaxID=44670 RepID=UPI00298F763E|nr:inactive serine/threonine-protein kinase 19-like isoform X1 [Metopolophium dirhodum]
MSSSDIDDNSIPINDLPNDTEAAIRYIKTLLPVTVKDTFKYPPVVFIHQLYDIVHNKTLINKELEILRKQSKIQKLTIGTSDSSSALILYEDYVKYTLNIYPENRCVNKFLNVILPSIKSFGVQKCTLLQQFKLQQYELTELINCGLLLIRNQESYWISFPSSGNFIKRYIEGRKYIIQIIKRRKFQEILESDLEVRCAKVSKIKELGFKYFLHDIKGSEDIIKMNTTSGCLLRIA